MSSSGNVSGKSKKKKKKKKKKKSQKANETANREVNNAEEEMNDGGETSEPQVEWEYYNLALQPCTFQASVCLHSCILKTQYRLLSLLNKSFSIVAS